MQPAECRRVERVARHRVPQANNVTFTDSVGNLSEVPGGGHPGANATATPKPRAQPRATKSKLPISQHRQFSVRGMGPESRFPLRSESAKIGSLIVENDAVAWSISHQGEATIYT